MFEKRFMFALLLAVIGAGIAGVCTALVSTSGLVIGGVAVAVGVIVFVSFSSRR